MKKILVTGALGQIGSELVPHLRAIYGEDNVIASDVDLKIEHALLKGGIFEQLDVLDSQRYLKIVKKHNVDTIMHLAALLSARAEANPMFAWNLNINGLINSLEICRECKLKFFTPSSIGAFGPSTIKDNTPQDVIQRPTTMYGITKVTGELLCDYYYLKYKVDTRGLRFPGLISYVAPPGGGTTDYAVSIYYDAILKGEYTSYIKESTFMDMMYMPDALNAIVDLMEADPQRLVHRNSFNISAMSIDPKMIENSIKKIIPNFKLHYKIDPVRQSIAESWPNSINSDAARREWNFTTKYDLDKMSEDMIEKLKIKLKKN